MKPQRSAEPSARLVRKQLLNALDEKLIPLMSASPLLIWGKPPLVVPSGVTVTPLPLLPLSEKRAQCGYHALDLAWPAAGVNSSHLPYLAIVFEGEADLRVGTTVHQAHDLRHMSADLRRKIPGVQVVGLPAPSAIMFPPGVPYSDGSSSHWERCGTPHLRIFWMHLLRSGAYCHLCRTDGTGHVSDFALLVEDAQLPAMANVFMEELRERAPDYQRVAPAQLTALLLRLRRRITLDAPILNSKASQSYFTPLTPPQGAKSARAVAVLAAIDDYLDRYLAQVVTLEQLARHVGLSSAHLNNLAKQASGTSLMRYVTQRRLEAACEMLRGDLLIQEIAHLCGYAHVSHFCQVFQRELKTTPSQWRRDYLHHSPDIKSV